MTSSARSSAVAKPLTIQGRAASWAMDGCTRRGPRPLRPAPPWLRLAVRIGRVGASRALVAVQGAVEIAIDPDALAGAGRDAGVGQGPAARGDDRAQLALGDRGNEAPVAPELAAAEVEEADLDGADAALGDEIAVTGVGARHQEV